MRTILLTFYILGLLSQSLGQSVLSSGTWHKIGITESGIYKIDKNFLSKKLGINVNSLNPKTLKVYGSGFNGMLPQPNGIKRAFDPVEYAIYAVGEADGSMDNDDYFLFYGNSPHHFSLDTSGHPNYEKNIYSDTTYLLITYGGADGKRISTIENPPASGNPITSYTDYIIHEKDETNFRKSGRRWLGERFSSGQLNQRFSYKKPGTTGAITVHLNVAAESESPSIVNVILNEAKIGSMTVSAITGGIYDNRAKDAMGSFSSVIDGTDINLDIVFDPPSEPFQAYLDYFIVSVERELRLYENQTEFHLPSDLSVASCQVMGADSQSRLWQVSDISNVKSQGFDALAGSRVLFTADHAKGGDYVIFKGNEFPAPVYFHKIVNQDLKAKAGTEGVIISPPEFLSEAMRLADFHRTHSGLSVDVFTTKQVYNEFSAGMQDISAIRDYFKYCYDNGNIKYALLFGDGSFDYKDRVKNNTNYVPVYESRQSFHPIFSYSSDDYYGFLEDDEGYWEEGKVGGQDYIEHTMEIGVGRLPVKTLNEAKSVVDKIVRYKTSDKTFGKWRNNIAYLTDDDENIHIKDAEALFSFIDTSYSEYNAKKLHLDAFEQEDDPMPRSPEAQRALLSAIEDGVFILNYLGHGSQIKLTDENLITSDVIDNLKNRQKLPFVVTATCDFGKYDDPAVVSGAERMLLHENGGAIALLTTTRKVYAHTNFKVNSAFHSNVFRKIDGEWPRLGDIQKSTKNESLGSGPVNRNFALLGDPMIRLNYPQYGISFDQLESETDTLSALEKYHLSGKIRDKGNVLVSGFNGKGTLTLWDIPQERVTKGQEAAPFQYEEQTNALYRGEVSIIDGHFELDFILPKNTSYKFMHGKLTMYAWNEKEFIDASGASRNFVLGGTAENVTSDNIPPTVKLYLNDSSFSSGGTVGTSSLLIAKLADESGINISNNGFNQSITLTLNEGDPIVLNDFYTASKDNFKKGTVLFPLQDLEPGKYQGTLKVWDTHNNSSSSTVEFNVSDKPIIKLYNTKIYPNPIASNEISTFAFEHDREGEELLVNISVYNMMGGEVHSLSYRIDNSPRKIDELKWRVGNSQGGQLEKGVYIYRLNVTSTRDDANNEVIKRLVIY